MKMDLALNKQWLICHKTKPNLQNLKTCDLTSKELSNEIKQYFDIDLNPACVQYILIKFIY